MLEHIALLKKQRQKIMSSLNRVQLDSPANPASRQLLYSTIEELIVHLEDQKSRFYPSVLELLEIQEDTSKLIRAFDTEIAIIKDEAIRITHNLICTNDEGEFHRNFSIFVTGLQLRFVREEQMIFRKVEELLARQYYNAHTH